jgi:hypothetical protein
MDLLSALSTIWGWIKQARFAVPLAGVAFIAILLAIGRKAGLNTEDIWQGGILVIILGVGLGLLNNLSHDELLKRVVTWGLAILFLIAAYRVVVRYTNFQRTHPVPAPDNITFDIKNGRTYFEYLTAPMQNGSQKGWLETSQLMIIKQSLAKISSPTDNWQSVVLERRDPVQQPSDSATYLLDVNVLANHGTDYAERGVPLVSYFGWLIRKDESGWLMLLPMKFDPDKSQPHFQLRVTFPVMQPGDTIAICLQRRPETSPAEFGDNASITLSKTGQ